MARPEKTLKIYGVPLSQPVRVVLWLLLYKREPFEFILANPGSTRPNGTRHPIFLAINPNGMIPFIEDPDTGVAIAEAHAILVYLCRKNGWYDLYPENPAGCAKIDAILHSHHRGLRNASVGFFAPNVRKDLHFPEPVVDIAHKTFSRALRVIEDNQLNQSRFLIGNEMTIADLASYVEIGQLQPQFTNLFDFEPFPNTRRWMHDMAQIEGHNDVHACLTRLGDISAQEPDIETIIAANKLGFATLAQRLSLTAN